MANGPELDWDRLCRRIERLPLPANLGAFVDRAAKRFGPQRAWCFFERSEDLSCREMRDYVNRAANALRPSTWTT